MSDYLCTCQIPEQFNAYFSTIGIILKSTYVYLNVAGLSREKLANSSCPHDTSYCTCPITTQNTVV